MSVSRNKRKNYMIVASVSDYWAVSDKNIVTANGGGYLEFA